MVTTVACGASSSIYSASTALLLDALAWSSCIQLQFFSCHSVGRLSVVVLATFLVYFFNQLCVRDSNNNNLRTPLVIILIYAFIAFCLLPPFSGFCWLSVCIWFVFCLDIRILTARRIILGSAIIAMSIFFIFHSLIFRLVHGAYA